MKDNFSTQSDDYKKFRPEYPKELIEYLISIVEAHGNCWDCGTGNGQLAVELAKKFEHVYATDISEKQLKMRVSDPILSTHNNQQRKQTFLIIISI